MPKIFSMDKENSLCSMNINLLKQGADILKEITDEQYVHLDSSYYRGAVGGHIRHILDHYECLLNGWNDKVDYDARNRNQEIETKRTAAILKIDQLIIRFSQMISDDTTLDEIVLVKSNAGDKDPDSPWSSSTIKRELQFLVSHTVHHYALIALILRIQNISVPDSLGVAPSTLNYRAGNDATGMKR